MGDPEAMECIWKESKARVKTIGFGDPITNICAGENNPHRHSYFVRYDKHFHVECTDKKGFFWNTSIEVIHPGHMDYEQAKVLFDPVWQARFGEKK